MEPETNKMQHGLNEQTPQNKAGRVEGAEYKPFFQKKKNEWHNSLSFALIYFFIQSWFGSTAPQPELT